MCQAPCSLRSTQECTQAHISERSTTSRNLSKVNKKCAQTLVKREKRMRERSLQNYLVKKIRNKKIRNDQCITIKRMIKQIICTMYNVQ